MTLALIAVLITNFNCQERTPSDKEAPSIVDTLYYNLPLPNFWFLYENYQNDSLYKNFYIAALKITDWYSLFYNGKSTMAYYFLKNSYHSTAEFFANETFVRKFNFYFDTTQYAGYLYSTYDSDTLVIWEGYYDNNFVEPKLLTFGSSHIKAKFGYFIFYKNVINPYPQIKVTWQTNIQDTLLLKKFEVLDYTDYEHYGETLKFYKIQNSNFDTKIIIEYPQKEKTEIQYNSTEKYGRILDENIFGDSQWHCWGKNLKNVNCITKK